MYSWKLVTGCWCELNTMLTQKNNDVLLGFVRIHIYYEILHFSVIYNFFLVQQLVISSTSRLSYLLKVYYFEQNVIGTHFILVMWCISEWNKIFNEKMLFYPSGINWMVKRVSARHIKGILLLSIWKMESNKRKSWTWKTDGSFVDSL